MDRKEISNITMVLMVATAVAYDIVQFLFNFIPFIGWIISWVIFIFAFMTFYVWFKIYGRNFMTPKRAVAMGAGVIIEMIPILNSLPGWTIAVLFLIGIEKAEKLASSLPGGAVVANTVGKSIPGKYGPTK